MYGFTYEKIEIERIGLLIGRCYERYINEGHSHGEYMGGGGGGEDSNVNASYAL